MSATQGEVVTIIVFCLLGALATPAPPIANDEPVETDTTLAPALDIEPLFEDVAGDEEVTEVKIQTMTLSPSPTAAVTELSTKTTLPIATPIPSPPVLPEIPSEQQSGFVGQSLSDKQLLSKFQNNLSPQNSQSPSNQQPQGFRPPQFNPQASQQQFQSQQQQFPRQQQHSNFPQSQ